MSKADNWPTHGQTHTCAHCAFYVPKLSGKVGRCRRHAPMMAGFPVVYPTDWCGDHKLDAERDAPTGPEPDCPLCGRGVPFSHAEPGYHQVGANAFAYCLRGAARPA